MGGVVRCDSFHVEDGGNFILNGDTHIPNYTASRVKPVSLIPTRQAKIYITFCILFSCTGFWWVKTEERRPRGIPSIRWEANIELDIQEVA